MKWNVFTVKLGKNNICGGDHISHWYFWERNFVNDKVHDPVPK